MKRDMELVREILREVERWPSTGVWEPVQVAGHEENEVSFHVVLMSEAGLLVANVLEGRGTNVTHVNRLTWDGYEFLDAARNDVAWKNALSVFKREGVGVVFEVLKQVLTRYATEAVFRGS